MTEVKKDFVDKLRSKLQNEFYQSSIFYAIGNLPTAPTIYKVWNKKASC